MFVQDLPWRHQLLRHFPMILLVLDFTLSGKIGINLTTAVKIANALFFSSVGITCWLYSRRVLQQSGCEAMQKVNRTFDDVIYLPQVGRHALQKL